MSMKFLGDAKMARLRWAFVGQDGMRAGWGIFLFIALFAGAIVGIRFILGGHAPSGDLTAKSGIIMESFSLGLAVIVTSLVGWIERKPFWFYGFSGSRPMAKFVTGFIGGLICLSLLVGILYATGYLVFDGVALHGLPVLNYGLAWLLMFFLTGVSEEFMLRGYLQNTFMRGIGKWPAFIVVAAIFTILHLQNDGETALGITGVFVGGLLLSWLRWLSGSLWLGIGFHAAWDWAQSYLYGTPDSGRIVQGHLLISHAVGDVHMSGGSAGPEGSLFMQPVLVGGLLLLMLVLRRAGLAANSGQVKVQ
jgi:membrane protease YdiL (CAAX protease family)